MSLNMKFNYLKQLAAQHGLTLGSSSPRRVRLLTQIGVPFDQIVPEITEDRKPGEAPCEYAQRLANEKAVAVGARTNNSIVVSCDTIVVLGNRILEKPVDEDDAFDILTALSGRMHTVCSALTLYGRGRILSFGHETTDVYFNSATSEKIKSYILTGEPMDKAGAYGIQGKGAFLVDRISGNLDNVIGLPCHLLDNLAQETLELL